MTNLVKLTIDDIEYEVPEDMNLVDAAKQYANVDIPVFCYHPKLGHDGNCRMCLVQLATPRPNRETGEMELAWFPTPQTACTQRVSEGMTIRTTTQTVTDARREILEFLLSSHPLDCPICDKGGECPLQTLTMRHGPGTSRMYWDDRMHLGKHVPLGELIYLDQERCIQCSRCIRFQDHIAGDRVLDFDMRGRKAQIITHSDPGFDSIFSGNTTDICPVGALTTADFRFNARPWEMVQVGTVCTHCPVGCNMTFDTRTDREAGGRTTIKRIMPRQNEAVNEIWICDKGRFAHHYMEHSDRLTTPMMRKGGKLVEATWDEALDEVAALIKSAGVNVAALAGGRLSNEDYFALQSLIRNQGSSHLDVYPNYVAGGEFAAQVGVGVGTDLQQLGAGDAILVVASDLHQEAPIWWLRVKAAAERGAALIVLNGRYTRLDDYATHAIRYKYGAEVAMLNAMLGSRKPTASGIDGLNEAYKQGQELKADTALKAAAKDFAESENAVVFVGGDGMQGATSHYVAQAAANLLLASDHVGRANNGLIIVWPFANGQGASDMGLRPDYAPGYRPAGQPGMGYEDILTALGENSLQLLYIAGADPVYDDPAAEAALRNAKGTIVVQDMFMTVTAELADIVLPSQSQAEREGTMTTGERRVQRFYPAIEPAGDSLPDWYITQLVEQRLGAEAPAASAASVLLELGRIIPQYAGITYQALARVQRQFPDVGGDDLYYGGTAFQNTHGLGVQWPSEAEKEGAALSTVAAAAEGAVKAERGELLLVPTSVLYDREAPLNKTGMLAMRTPEPHIGLNPATAAAQKIDDYDLLEVVVNGHTLQAIAYLDEGVPQGVGLLPRRLQKHGTLSRPASAKIQVLEKVGA